MITILTDPIPTGRLLIPQLCREAARGVRNILRPPKFNFGAYRGHYAVTRSLVEGLKKAGLRHNYNPRSLRQLADVVVVLADIRTLKQAIELKRKGYIRKIYAGPNIVVFSSDADSILASPEVDAVITPCSWVIDLYVEDNPTLEGRCFPWPAGVDIDYWKPAANQERKQILIFDKQNKGPVGPIEPYADYLRGRGYPVQILQYGNFTHDEYLHALQHSRLMVGFVTDESQGIAWAEAWATDVPTLIWRNGTGYYRGRNYACSTAPYLCDSNGLFFDNLDDFSKQFTRWEESASCFTPRDWTISNMSDEACARDLYKKVFEC